MTRETLLRYHGMEQCTLEEVYKNGLHCIVVLSEPILTFSCSCSSSPESELMISFLHMPQLLSTEYAVAV